MTGPGPGQGGVVVGWSGLGWVGLGQDGVLRSGGHRKRAALGSAERRAQQIRGRLHGANYTVGTNAQSCAHTNCTHTARAHIIHTTANMPQPHTHMETDRHNCVVHT